jgi:hypothetical protein
MRRTIPILLIALANFAFGQEGGQAPVTKQSAIEQDVLTTEGKVTIASKGADVRGVLFDLFTQSKTNFVLEPNVYFILYLSLAGTEFAETLDIVCNLAGLEYQIDNGIYFVGKKKTGGATLVKPENKPTPTVPAKKGKLTESEMNKRLTTRFTKTSIADVFKSMTEQTGVAILLDADVPIYRMDAYLIDTSLQYAMDVISRSAGLTYTLTDDKQIRVSKK